MRREIVAPLEAGFVMTACSVPVHGDIVVREELRDREVAPLREVSMRRTIERLQAEFLEMPGLRLTVGQVQRLCGVDEAVCQGVLDRLVDVKFLRANADGTYARLSDGDAPRAVQQPRA